MAQTAVSKRGPPPPRNITDILPNTRDVCLWYFFLCVFNSSNCIFTKEKHFWPELSLINKIQNQVILLNLGNYTRIFSPRINVTYWMFNRVHFNGWNFSLVISFSQHPWFLYVCQILWICLCFCIAEMSTLYSNGRMPMINREQNVKYLWLLFNLHTNCNTYIKTKTKKPLFYLDNIFNNLLIFNTVQTNNIEWHNNIQNKQLKIIKTG